MALNRIAWATAYLLIYHGLFILGLDPLVALFFSFSPVVMFWMVWNILRDPFSTEKTWNRGDRYLDM